MDEYKQYLASRVLTDGLPTTYRLLSRALKVHVNLARQMLYDFHTSQNSKHPKSIHATYLVSGIKKKEPVIRQQSARDGDDMVLESSPFPSSLLPPEEEPRPDIPLRTVTIVREEELEALKTEFEEITSIHIYSIQPNSPKDLHQLTAVNQEIYTQDPGNDPLETNKVYGTILNSAVERRKGVKPETLKRIAAANLAATKATSTTTNPKTILKPDTKPGTTSKEAAKPSTVAPSKPKGGALFNSFAKAKPKEAKPPKTELKKEEDTPMNDMFDDDDDEDDDAVNEALLAAASKVDTAKAAEVKRAREDREAKLRQMMELEDDDEPMGDAADSPVQEEIEEAKPIDAPAAPVQEEKQEQSTSQNGRRRGRRRVMKKKTYTDDEGYLVTKEEAEWESFSEEEPEVKKPKLVSQNSGSMKKKPQAKGQGNIMSFFGKKG